MHLKGGERRYKTKDCKFKPNEKRIPRVMVILPLLGRCEYDINNFNIIVTILITSQSNPYSLRIQILIYNK